MSEDFNLEVAWWDAMQQLGVEDSELAQDFIDGIYDRYNEPHRHYHTVAHIEHMLEVLKELDLYNAVLILAVIFHDVIYDTQSTSDNELRSAILARSCLELLNPPEPPPAVPTIQFKTPSVAERVYDLVLSTAQHDGGNDYGAIILNDIDMSILGADRGIYDLYAHNIRLEYQHVNDADYRAGRIKVLQSFLDRERIFFSHNMWLKYEMAARENIQREIERLS